jgi:hypothetical protein
MFGFQRNPVFREDGEDGEFHCSIIIRPLITASAQTWFITHFMLKIVNLYNKGLSLLN